MEGLFSDYEEARRSGLFDAEYYLATYPDVAERNVDPLVHYLEEGARAGRSPHPDFDAAYYLEQCRAQGEAPANPLLHYLRHGAARGLKRRRGAAEEARQPIRVAIETLGVTGRADGGVQIAIGGWALAAAPIAAISAGLGDAVLATAAYGLARPDLAPLHPDRPEARTSGFLLSLDLPPLERAAVEPVLSVHTAAGEVGRRRLRVEIPPAELDIGVVDPLAAAEEGAADPGAAAMLLAIERATVDRAGILRVEGWVLCRVRIERVEVFLDGEALGEAAVGRARDDIAGLHRDYPNARFCGFVLAAAVEATPGRHRLTVKATARAGVVREASATVAVVPPPPAPAAAPEVGIRCHCDERALRADGQLALRGWAVGPAPAAALLVLLDDREVGRAELGLERPDVGNLFPALAHARRSGFFFAARTAHPVRGEHRLRLRLCLADGAVHDETMTLDAGANRDGGDPATAADSERLLHLDAPPLIGGALAAPVRGNLEIGGWALAKSGVAAVEIAIDDVPFALAERGLRRLDIRAAFPDWDGAAASGFTALLPHRILPKGSHSLSVTLRDQEGGSVSTAFGIEVEELGDVPGPWALRRNIGQAEIDLAGRLLERCGRRPLFAALLPLASDPQSLARAHTTIAALRAQAYAEWRLLMVPQGRRDKPAIAALAKGDSRITLAPQPTREALAELAAATGTPAEGLFLLPLLPGDKLGIDAFLEMALAAALHPGADFLYSDERRRNPASGRIEAFFKPRWSPDLLLSTNYLGRLWCARGDLLAAVAAPAERLFGDGEYDLVLRCTEKAKRVHHVAAVLCERADEIDDGEQAKAALARAAARRGFAATVENGPLPGTWRLKRELARPGPVSIIIPTCAAGGLIATCIESLRRLTRYRDYQILCIENIAPADARWRRWLARHADRVIATREEFNWARFNNLAAREARGEYLLFLNDDIEVTEPDWLAAMLEEAQRPDVGAVGARLLYPDGRVQHAGMFLAAMGQARHAFRYAAGEDPGYFGLALTRRNVIAVTGACLLTRRDTFEELGGFDEAQAIVNNDLDYCLRAWRSGRVNLYTPFATLTHREAASRAALPDDYDVSSFDRKWRDLFLAGDPYFSPHLSKEQDGFAIEQEPTQLLVTGPPLFRSADIRKILVVKLDHIGDCVITFPAVRRLKAHFPAAQITVLSSRASRPIWALEPSVAATIEFDFFHARSELGELDRSEEDWQALRGRLVPERFDLAVDLRKHTETRPVLQHTGARWLAGFDFRNQFPWLDIALEWTGDQAYVHKRQHNGEDLLNLVDALAAAGSGERAAIAAPPAAAPALPSMAGAGPLVCVHPTVGNSVKQWPLEYFAALIDRLVEADGARVVLIGAPGDEEAAAAILRQVRHPPAVASLVGTLPLAELPSLLAGAALFVGSDSGPKHIAAGLGVPTVAVHGGTVDVREWGPLGPAAIAVARDMVCAPCYLAHAEDCRRGLACLTGLAPARVYEACRRLLPLAAPGAPASPPRDGAARPGRKRRSGRLPAPRAAAEAP